MIAENSTVHQNAEPIIDASATANRVSRKRLFMDSNIEQSVQTDRDSNASQVKRTPNIKTPNSNFDDNQEEEMEIDTDNNNVIEVVNNNHEPAAMPGANFNANEDEEGENLVDLNLPRNILPPELINEADNEVVEHILHQNEDDMEQLGPLAVPIVRKLTYIRLCDENCPALQLEVGSQLHMWLTHSVRLPPVSYYLNRSIIMFVMF